jgi:hypothetical protein
MEIVDLIVVESMKWTYLMFMQIWSIPNYMDFFFDNRNSYIYAWTRWFEGLKLFLVIYFDNYKLFDTNYIIG